jgi:uncharacterized membrane protein
MAEEKAEVKKIQLYMACIVAIVICVLGLAVGGVHVALNSVTVVTIWLSRVSLILLVAAGAGIWWSVQQT